VLTSVNGVQAFFDRLRALRRDVRVLHRARVAAVGPETAAALEARGVLVDVVPEEFRAEGVAAAMKAVGIAGQRVLLPRAAAAREILPAMLRDSGAEVDEVATYETKAPRRDPTRAQELRELLESGAIDLITFTSSSTVRQWVELVGDQANSVPAGCIGPITADTARAAGFEVVVQPEAYTIPAFTVAILEYFQKKDSHHRGTQSTRRGDDPL
jgi:uroporphyrinogen III methyltransferase/synthase